MRIAIMGAGGVGGYVGALLAAAGEDIAFIARGPHFDAMRANGLRIESPSGNLHLQNVIAHDDPSQIGVVDVVLFAVKLWDTETAAHQLKSLLGPNTRVITLQNGIDSVDLISPSVPREKIVAGVVYMSAFLAEPGLIRSPGWTCRLILDEAGGNESVAGFVAACGRANGIEAQATASIEPIIWKKFIVVCAASGATALLRSSLGPIFANPETRAFFRQLVEEGAAIGRVLGVGLGDRFVEDTMEMIASSVPSNTRASMAEDLAHGRRLELNWLAGRMHALGIRYGVPTPAQTAVYRGLLLYADGGSQTQ